MKTYCFVCQTARFSSWKESLFFYFIFIANLKRFMRKCSVKSCNESMNRSDEHEERVPVERRFCRQMMLVFFLHSAEDEYSFIARRYVKVKRIIAFRVVFIPMSDSWINHALANTTTKKCSRWHVMMSVDKWIDTLLLGDYNRRSVWLRLGFWRVDIFILGNADRIKRLYGSSFQGKKSKVTWKVTWICKWFLFFKVWF
jgi:hypothetical protein